MEGVVSTFSAGVAKHREMLQKIVNYKAFPRFLWRELDQRCFPKEDAKEICSNIIDSN